MILQVALDFIDLERALKVAREAVRGGADWLEAGTPLIKSEGLNSVRALHEEFPGHVIVADMKTMDAGRVEMESAAKAGARVAIVMGAASDATIQECIEAGANYGLEVGVDMLGVADPAARAKQVQAWGASHVGVHTSIDEQMQGKDPFNVLRAVRDSVGIAIAVAGGINSETAAEAAAAGADIVVVGGAIAKAEDAEAATRAIKDAISKKTRVATDRYKRVTSGGIREILERVSTANISDGAHRMPGLEGIQSVARGLKLVGPALTVRTYPGDWAKPVEAIDIAAAGSVIVIDAGGVGPAVWGEMATHSAMHRGLAGVVIHGAIRDTKEIQALRFPAFARLMAPNAGEPRGMGEINVPILVSGVRVFPGDWVVGDDDGVVVIPRGRAAEVTNRAMDWFEKECRLIAEIKSGKTTLASVMELLKWEKRM